MTRNRKYIVAGDATVSFVLEAKDKESAVKKTIEILEMSLNPDIDFEYDSLEAIEYEGP